MCPATGSIEPRAGGVGGGGGGGRSYKTVFASPVTVEEIWLAQEDFWVKRELLKLIRQALYEEALCQEVKLDKKDVAADFVLHKRFRNRNWEIDLLFEQADRKLRISGKSTIRNIDPAKRILSLANLTNDRGIEFRIEQGDNEQVLEIKGQPLAWNKVAQFENPISLQSIIDPKKPFELIQVLDWAASPIKRIDDLRLGVLFERAKDVPLVANKSIPTETSSSAPGKAAGAKGGGKQGFGGPKGGEAASGGNPVGGPASASPANGLTRNRYLYVTEQCRHMPFTLKVIIDQNHIADLLATLAQSKLRIQVTEVKFQHVEGITPNLEELVEPKADGSAAPSPKIEPDGNLVELSVWGVASLYQRFEEPPLPKDKQPTPAPKDKQPSPAPKDKQPSTAPAPKGTQPTPAPKDKQPSTAPKDKQPAPVQPPEKK
jgi:hypothetical protein